MLTIRLIFAYIISFVTGVWKAFTDAFTDTKAVLLALTAALALMATACDSVPEPFVRLAVEQFIWPVLAALGSLVLYRLNAWIKLRTKDVRKQAIALKLENLVAKAVALTAQTYVQECVNRSGEGLTRDEAAQAAAHTLITLKRWLGEEGLAEASEIASDVSEYLKALIEAQVAINKGRAL